jgi:putative ABC transport system permease protein
MMMVAAFGLLAVVVALPAGAALAYVNSRAVAGFLNVDILNFHIPPHVLVLEVLAALFAPMVSAVIPIINGTRVTVREAVSDYGLGTRRKRNLIDYLLARLRGLPRPLLLSLRNTFRRRGRLFLTLGTLTLAGALFISVVNVRGSMLAELDRIMGVYNYDIAVLLDDTYQNDGVERRVTRVPGVTRAQGMGFATGKRIRPDGSNGPTFELLGVPPSTSLLQPTIVEGRWMESGDRNAIVVSTEWLKAEFDVRVGDTVTLEIRGDETEWEVVGIYLLPGDSTVYGTFDFVSRAQDTPGLTSFILVETEIRSGEFQDQVADELEERLKGGGIGVSQVITRDLIVGASVSQFDFLIKFLLSTAVLVAIVGGLGLAGTMSLNVLERTREIGVMRAIGASNGAVRGVVMVEGMVIGLLSWALAAPLSVAMSIGFATALGIAIFERPIPFSFSPIGLVGWLAIAVIISAIASLLPARRAAAISVREALAYE